MRALLGAVAIAAVSAALLTGGADAHRNAPKWTLVYLMKRIDGAHVKIGDWSGRVRAASTLCSGEGAASRWGGIGHWRHFTCTWTTFNQAGGLDRDVTFRVHTLSRTGFLITAVHFGTV